MVQTIKSLDKSIIITPTFDTLFSLNFQDSIILKREFRVLWFFRKPVRYFEKIFLRVSIQLRKKDAFKKFSKVW